MQLTKIKILEEIKTWTAAFGLTSLVVGGSGCVIGLTATGIIKAGELLSYNRATITKIIFYGSASSGAGLFLIGLATKLSVIGEEICEDELRRINGEVQEETKQEFKYPACLNCKYFSNNLFLPCAVHPKLNKDCRDWELSAR